MTLVVFKFPVCSSFVFRGSVYLPRFFNLSAYLSTSLDSIMFACTIWYALELQMRLGGMSLAGQLRSVFFS